MISIEAYKENPCKVLSVPYWKAKRISIPSNMRIMHNSDFDKKQPEYDVDQRYFRLIHHLSSIPEFGEVGIGLEVISFDRSAELADMINRSYTHSEIRVSEDFVKSWMDTEVYCPELWIGAISDRNLIGSILCDFDREVGEAIIEWLQVLPEYRSRGIASALLSRALKTMRSFADFATVSGECDNVTNPELVYRRCGFEGNDIWHVMTCIKGEKTDAVWDADVN